MRPTALQHLQAIGGSAYTLDNLLGAVREGALKFEPRQQVDGSRMATGLGSR